MSVKDFAQKNGVALFYSTIILLVLVIVLGVYVLMGGSKGGPGSGGMPPEGFGGDQTQGEASDATGQTGRRPSGTQSSPSGSATGGANQAADQSQPAKN